MCRFQGQRGPACSMPGQDEASEIIQKMKARIIFSFFFPPFPPLFSSGRLWRPPAVPAGAGPLGGARRGELRTHRLHRGEQTQRVHPHSRLHPLDRGDAHQGLLPALSSDSAPVCLVSDVQRRPQTHSCFILRQQVHHFWNS